MIIKSFIPIIEANFALHFRKISRNVQSIQNGWAFILNKEESHLDLFQLKTRPVVIRRELLDHYAELGMDEQDLVILIKLIYASETSNKQPSIETLQQGSSMQPRQITSVIQNLIQRELLELNVRKDEEGKFTEYMNLDPFYEKLSQILKKQNLDHQESDSVEQFKQLFQLMEQSFGRPLSPYEIETLNQWIDVDQHDLSVIQAALVRST